MNDSYNANPDRRKVAEVENVEQVGLIVLVAGAQRDEPGALDRLLTELRPFVRGLAQSVLIKEGLNNRIATRLDASDITQETLIAVSQKISAFLGSTEPEFVAWVKSILRHDIADSVRQHIRSQTRSINREAQKNSSTVDHRDTLDQFASRGSSPSWALNQKEKENQLQEAIAALDERDQTIVRLSLFDRATQAQIAEQVGMTPAGVAKRLERAKKKLHFLLNCNE